MRTIHLLLSAPMSLGVVLAASQALAQSECAADADCDAGFVCAVVGSSGCAGAACPEDDPDCVSEPVDCEPEEFRACTPGPCESDADCGENMVCETYESAPCGGVSETCDADGNCTTTVEECDSTPVSQCTYRWHTACEVDADCGDGFTCTPLEVDCGCASGGGTEPGVAMEGDESAGSEDTAAEGAPAEAPSEEGEAEQAEPPPDEDAPPPDELIEDCSCPETSTELYCKAEEIPCEAATDCPEGWTCEALGGFDCGGGSSGEDPVDMERPAIEPLPPEMIDVDGGAPAAEEDPAAEEPPVAEDLPVEEDNPCEPVVSAMQCVPPGGAWFGDTGGVGAPTAGAGEDPRDDGAVGSDDGEVTTPDEDTPTEDNAADDDVALGDDDAQEGETPEEEPGAGDDAADDDASEGDDDAAEDDAAEDDDAADDDDTETTAADTSGDDGGCSVTGHREAPSAGWLAALLGLAFLRRRRS